MRDCADIGEPQRQSGSGEIARGFADCGFRIVSTGETCRLIQEAGIPAERVNKLYEGRPNILDMITNGQIDLIVNSPSGKESVHDDSYLRKAAIKAKIPYMTTIAAARATFKGIHYVQQHGNGEVKSLQQLHSEIRAKNPCKSSGDRYNRMKSLEKVQL